MNDPSTNVLLVEDDADDALLIERALRQTNRLASIKIVHVTNLETALSYLESTITAVVLLDLGLPDGQGLDSLRTVCAAAPNVPVIVLTGREDEALSIEALRLGAEDYITKGQLDGAAVARSIIYAIERHLLRRGLKESEGRYRAIIETAEEGIWVLSPEDKTGFANRKLADMLGTTPEEMAGRSFFSFMDPEEEVLAKAHSERRRAGMKDVRNFKLRRKDGTPVWTLCATSPLFDEDGRHLGTLAMVTDMTVRQSLESQLRQAQKMEAIGRLAGGVAHDFNNLLLVMSGYSTFALAKLGDDHSARADVEEVFKATGRAASLTRQLLAFSRKQVFSPRVVSLNSIVGELDKMLRRLIEEHITLEMSLDPDLFLARADPSQMEQVVMNLLLNARDAMPAGGKVKIGTGNVVLDREFVASHHGSAPGPHVVLWVSDTGMGMDKETLSHLFEPFFTTKGEGKGTGLGMATVYGIVKQTGGYIIVESEPSRGTTVRIYLPRAEGNQPTSPITRTIKILQGKERILLVEDEPAVRRLLAGILRTNGYEVSEAGHPQEAIELCETRQVVVPDLLVTDMVMPGMSGRELFRRLSSVNAALKGLILSGYTTDVVMRQGTLEPGTGFLQKPFAAEDLLRKVRKLLEHPAARKEN